MIVHTRAHTHTLQLCRIGNEIACRHLSVNNNKGMKTEKLPLKKYYHLIIYCMSKPTNYPKHKDSPATATINV